MISRNERLSVVINEDTPLPSPTSLTGILTDFGISLNWTMPIETNQSNTTGYKIFRKTDNDDYILIYTTII